MRFCVPENPEFITGCCKCQNMFSEKKKIYIYIYLLNFLPRLLRVKVLDNNNNNKH